MVVRASFFPGGSVNATSSSTSSKSKKPCKYGPRDSDGYCPKAPKKAKTAAKKKPCKYGPRDEDGYCPKKGTYTSSSTKAAPVKKMTKKQSKMVNTAAKVGSKAAEQLVGVVFDIGTNKAKRDAVKEVVKNVANLPVGLVGKAAVGGSAVAGGLLTGIALAGIASYWITSKIVAYYPKKAAENSAAAAEAAAAYAAARKDAVAKQKGKPLTAAQNKVLSDVFKQTLKDRGITWPLRQ